jgi:phosphatidylethanolamine-binding protein
MITSHNAQPSCITNQKPVTDTIYQALSPLSTQQHRYTFLVYRQPPGYTPDLVTLQTRPGFNVNTYAASKGLTLVGGNFLREAITNGVTT